MRLVSGFQFDSHTDRIEGFADKGGQSLGIGGIFLLFDMLIPPVAGFRDQSLSGFFIGIGSAFSENRRRLLGRFQIKLGVAAGNTLLGLCTAVRSPSLIFAPSVISTRRLRHKIPASSSTRWNSVAPAG